MATIGFIGLGRMGRPMASNLCRKGFQLAVYDINREPVREVERLGAHAAASVAEVAAASDVVLTMLTNSAIVEDVMLGSGGVVASGRRGTLIVDMSTVDPLVTDRVAAAAAENECSFVDAPVGRLASHADRGECLFMVGATPANLERVMPLLKAMGTTIHHCGTGGAGMRMKLVNNYLAIVLC